MRLATALLLWAVVAITPSCHPPFSQPTSLPDTPLLRGIESQPYERGSAIIRERIDGRFKVGGEEGDLSGWLEKQGLHVKRTLNPRSASARIEGLAEVRTWSIPCGSQVRVWWTADVNGRLRELGSLYSDTGCP